MACLAMDHNELVSRQATFALFDACAIKREWVMVRQRVQGEALAYVKDARRGDGASHVRWPRITPCHAQTGLRG